MNSIEKFIAIHKEAIERICQNDDADWYARTGKFTSYFSTLTYEQLVELLQLALDWKEHE